MLSKHSAALKYFAPILFGWLNCSFHNVSAKSFFSFHWAYKLFEKKEKLSYSDNGDRKKRRKNTTRIYMPKTLLLLIIKKISFNIFYWYVCYFCEYLLCNDNFRLLELFICVLIFKSFTLTDTLNKKAKICYCLSMVWKLLKSNEME